MMRIRLELIFLAILGSLFAYSIVCSLIIPISFTKYFLIEVTLTLMHALYGYRRRSMLKKV
jgi:hypothetical protein